MIFSRATARLSGLAARAPRPPTLTSVARPAFDSVRGATSVARPAFDSVRGAAAIAGAVAVASTAGVALCGGGAKKKWTEEALPERKQAELESRVDVWLATAAPGGKALPLHFEPALSAGERKFVHALCETRRSEVSSKSEGSGRARHVVVYHTPIEVGMVGGVSAARRTELAARVEEFKIDGQSPQGLHFEPSLTTAEREFVHQVAAQHGLSSKSEGKVYHGADWHIVVRH